MNKKPATWTLRLPKPQIKRSTNLPRKNLGTLIARLPPTLRRPASVARYTLSWSWTVCRSVLASGVAVVKVSMANCSADELDLEKSMLLNETLPEVTSGTLSMVVAVVEHVTDDWIAVTESCTSAGRAVLPTTKQAFARDSSGAMERTSRSDLFLG